MRIKKENKFLPEKLEECRCLANMSVARMLHEWFLVDIRISHQTYYNWINEASSPSVVLLPKIANFYKKEIRYFFN